jgi:hypothetical protein
MTYTTTIRDEFGNLVHDVQRQVESDRRLTLAEWTDAAEQNLYEDMSMPAQEVGEVTQVEFFTH